MDKRLSCLEGSIISNPHHHYSVIEGLELLQADVFAESYVSNKPAVWLFGYAGEIVGTVLREE